MKKKLTEAGSTRANEACYIKQSLTFLEQDSPGDREEINESEKELFDRFKSVGGADSGVEALRGDGPGRRARTPRL
ncbi:hypothetical protein PF005_g17277 [Phytophthora fragariae]|nr:hypothetical protein PF003_g23057 [Phytophthora fragariae]KAE8931424.1 hypothetical protein PF009_g18510 [Phytophthora fragariae]KAE9094991.1 hypothetical protein PF010_g16878 [Phytophthora fragariae]KAE9128059.1 hypothetical protein PF006_g16374 [Phytophthora fragariae]KAE9195476.1 hypothetical protein PF005_g17277 [Phytophthora fragariae]